MIREFKLNQKIKLKGLTQKGKNRIKQHGDTWKIIVCFSKSLSLESLNDTFRLPNGRMIRDGRWIDIPEDHDFEIIEVL